METTPQGDRERIKVFNITKENAEVFWNELEGQTNYLEHQVERLEAQVAEEVKKNPYAGSFAIQWQCGAIAGRNAVIVLRESTHHRDISRQDIRAPLQSRREHAWYRSSLF